MRSHTDLDPSHIRLGLLVAAGGPRPPLLPGGRALSCAAAAVLVALLVLTAAGCQLFRNELAQVTLSLVDAEELAVHDLVVGKPFGLTLKVEARAPFPGTGETLRLSFPHYYAFQLCSMPQGYSPLVPGYTRIVSAPEGVTLRFVNPDLAPLADDVPPGFEVLFERPMEPGEIVEIRYGQGRRGLGLAQALAVSPEVPGYEPISCDVIDADGKPVDRLASLKPRFVAGTCESLRLIVPATARPHQPFALRVVALDRFGNLALAFQGEVLFPSPMLSGLSGAVGGESPDASRPEGIASPRLGLPPSITFGPDDEGVKIVPSLTAGAAGVHRIRARLANRDCPETLSNPLVIQTTGPRVFFGDLHVHCGEISPDAYGGLRDVYEYARDVAGLDFVSKNDHGGDLTDQLWQRTRRLVEEFDRPGQFVTFLGFEWTPPYSWGHRSIIFPGADGLFVPFDHPEGNTPKKLWNLLRPYGAIGIIHMPSAEPNEHHHIDWDSHIPERAPLVEIYNQWVPYKQRLLAQDTATNRRGVQYALTRGHFLGIVGGSDNHTGMAARTGGLTGVHAMALTREDLFSALRARRTFGTTGERIQVYFTFADETGAPCDTATTVPIRLRGRVHGTSFLAKVEVVRGFARAEVPLRAAHILRPGRTMDFEFAWSDPAPPDSAFYYLRVTQQDGEMAWSRPLWARPLSGTQAGAAPTQVATRAWRSFDFPDTWESGSYEVPSHGAIDIQPLKQGALEVDTVLNAHPSPIETFRLNYFHVRTSPFRLPPGPVRLSVSMTSEKPAMVNAVVIDSSISNPGVYGTICLPGQNAPVQDSYTRIVEPHDSPVRLYLFFPAMENRYQLQSLTLERVASSQ